MIINFKGLDYQCPSWAKFIAVDASGEVFAYSKEPKCDDNDTVWDSSGEQERICTLEIYDSWRYEIYTVQ